MRGELVVSLAELGREDLAVAGGKGANLGELLRAGMNVPAGFVVTTAAYERFVAHNGLSEVIDAVLQEGEDDGAAIREAFDRGDVPSELQEAIVAAYERLGAGPVAVRSSATAEDLPQAAFAGQQDTYLNVVGAKALLQAVQRCLASLWTDRAIAYRRRQGVEERAALAVVVQRMAPATAAGVMFTANPVSGARDETAIDASAGLGEAVVSGQVTPDHFLLRRRRGRWRLVEQRAGKRELIVRPLPGGGTEHLVDPDGLREELMPADVLRRLADLGEQIETHFGAPQDVEWAWDGEQLFILQARPITALPEPAPKVSRSVRLVAGILAEMIPARPFPLEATTWGPDLMWSSFVIPFMHLLGLKALTTEVLLPEEDGVMVGFSARVPVRLTPRILLAPWRLLRRARRYNPLEWQADPLLEEARERARQLNERDLGALDWKGLADTVHEALAVPAYFFELRFRYLPGGMLATAALRLMLALLRRGELFGALILTGVETKTLEANRAMETLAAQVRGDPTLSQTFARHEAGELWAALEAQPQGRIFLQQLRTFLDEYGHREAGGTMLLSQETWRDAPHVVLGALKGMATLAPRPSHGVQPYQMAREEVLSRPLMRVPGVRRLFAGLLKRARSFIQVREDTRFYATLVMPVLRHALLEMGRRLHDAGILREVEDVFHLKMDELEAAGEHWPPSQETAQELVLLVRRRKEKRAALANRPLIDPRLYHRTPSRQDALLLGTPGSPGVVQGPVRVVRDGSEFGKLRPGDVLVAPYTNPAWTPLFQHAAAVVVDTGSAASHAAITAREYGIPAVMATGDGTAKLQDGQMVRVDGGRGVVEEIRD